MRTRIQACSLCLEAAYHAGAACPSPFFDCCPCLPVDLPFSGLQFYRKVWYLMVLDDEVVSLNSPSGAEKKLLVRRSWNGK